MKVQSKIKSSIFLLFSLYYINASFNSGVNYDISLINTGLSLNIGKIKCY